MPSTDFAAAVDRVLLKDARFDRNAYFFLREALDFTVGEAQKGKGAREAKPRHVRGQQLLEGLRKYALAQFGPMVPTVFDYWGIKKCEHIGDMVYSLIAVGYFAKSEQDSPEDFRGGYSFHDAFVSPFQPSAARVVRPVRSRSKGPRAKQGSQKAQGAAGASGTQGSLDPQNAQGGGQPPSASSGSVSQNTENSQSTAGPES